ncbi:MAG: hypothetical protein HOV81_05845 [Kofleriaceae bacterium]|nr:hypothetical protein [Kofleriaceae bacterium]
MSRWLAVVLLAACAGSTAPRPLDATALYRSGRMQEARASLGATRARDPNEAARIAVLAARIAIDLRVVWNQGSFDDALASLANARPTEPRLVAEVEQAMGEALFWKKLVGGEGSWDDLRVRFEHALELRKAAGDKRGIAESTFYRGLIAQFIETPAVARTWFERAVELGEDVDDPLMRSYPVRHLADLAESDGDLERAGKLHREALALRERAGDVLRLFNAQLTLATFSCERMRDCEAARPLIEAARQTATTLKMPHGMVEVAILEAQLAEWRGDAPARDAGWDRALAAATTSDDDGSVAAVRLARGAARLRTCDGDGALADASAVTTPDGRALAAQASLAAGKPDAATASIDAAWSGTEPPTARMYLAVAQSIESGHDVPPSAARAKLPREPRAWLDAALAAARRDHDTRTEIDVLVALGDREAAKKRADEAHFPLQASIQTCTAKPR